MTKYTFTASYDLICLVAIGKYKIACYYAESCPWVVGFDKYANDYTNDTQLNVHVNRLCCYDTDIRSYNHFC